MPFDNTFTANKTVYAQSGGFFTSGSTNFTSQNGPGLRGYIKGLAPAISQLPQCKAIIRSKIKSLFKNVKGVVTKLIAKKAAKKLAEQAADGAVEQNTVPTNDSSLNDKAEESKELQKESTELTSRLTENELCLKSIGQLVAKMLIQKITLSTINWIQSGYEGKPFFLQNPGKFFKDIAKNEILQFGVEVTGNPYGKEYLLGVVNRYNKHFQDNARYSLNELIKQTTPEYSDIQFKEDFGSGGWNAWDALTSVPANNPIGLQIMASNELSKRLEGTNKSTATKAKEGLDRSEGFLPFEVCANPEGITRAQHDAALELGKKEVIGGGSYYDNDRDGVPDDIDQIVDTDGDGEDDGIDNDIDGDGEENFTDIDPGGIENLIVINGNPTGYVEGTCKEWQTLTPGQFIAYKAERASGFQEDSLNNIKDLNTAVAAILDAVLAQFSSKFQEGFVKMTNEGSDGTLILSSYNADGNFLTPQTEIDFTPFQLNSRWLNENPDFNIRTDITQALIDEQRTYIQKLEEQNLEIPQLIMDIRQLDYCIPGPNPNWEETSSVENFYDSINTRVDLKGFEIASTIMDIALPIGGSALGSLIGFDPTQILSGVAQALLDSAKEKKIKAMMASYIGDLFEVHIYGAGQDDGIDNNGFGDNGHQDQVLDEGDIRSVVENSWNSYADNIYKIYFSGAKSLAYKAGAMPLVTVEARNEFEKITYYQRMAEENHDTIQTKKSMVKRLSAIKDAVEALGPVPNPDDFTTDDEYQEALDQYESLLKEPIAEFSRISNDMVSGDDIAEVDGVLKELQDKRNYVWDDLLKGPGGCEKHLEKFHADEPLEYSKFVRRQPYPLPVYYFYGTEAEGDGHAWDEQIAWSKELLKETKGSCPQGWSGEPPECQDPNGPKCPAPSIGKYPKCLIPPPPVPVPIPPLCPPGWGGPWPLCADPNPPPCPAGSVGDYPYCTQEGTTGFSKNEGFLYGMVYYNRWAGPDFAGNPPESGPDHDFDHDGIPNKNDDDDDDDEFPDFNDDGSVNDPDPYDDQVPDPNPDPKPAEYSGRMSLCPEYIQFPEDVDDDDSDVDGNGAYVELSLPSGISENNVPVDIGGLEPKGYGSGHPNRNGRNYKNICGVITRGFEKKFQIY